MSNERDIEEDLKLCEAATIPNKDGKLWSYYSASEAGMNLAEASGEILPYWLTRYKQLQNENERLLEALCQSVIRVDSLADLAADSTEMLVGHVGIVSGLNDLGDYLSTALNPQPQS